MNKKLCLILSEFDFAFKVDWSRDDHKEVNRYLSAITAEFAEKIKIDFYPFGNFLAFNFNERYFKNTGISIIRDLFKNQAPNSFHESKINECYIFTF